MEQPSSRPPRNWARTSTEDCLTRVVDPGEGAGSAPTASQGGREHGGWERGVRVVCCRSLLMGVVDYRRRRSRDTGLRGPRVHWWVTFESLTPDLSLGQSYYFFGTRTLPFIQFWLFSAGYFKQTINFS